MECDRWRLLVMIPFLLYIFLFFSFSLVLSLPEPDWYCVGYDAKYVYTPFGSSFLSYRFSVCRRLSVLPLDFQLEGRWRALVLSVCCDYHPIDVCGDIFSFPTLLLRKVESLAIRSTYGILCTFFLQCDQWTMSVPYLVFREFDRQLYPFIEFCALSLPLYVPEWLHCCLHVFQIVFFVQQQSVRFSSSAVSIRSIVPSLVGQSVFPRGTSPWEWLFNNSYAGGNGGSSISVV